MVLKLGNIPHKQYFTSFHSITSLAQLQGSNNGHRNCKKYIAHWSAAGMEMGGPLHSAKWYIVGMSPPIPKIVFFFFLSVFTNRKEKALAWMNGTRARIHRRRQRQTLYFHVKKWTSILFNGRVAFSIFMTSVMFTIFLVSWVIFRKFVECINTSLDFIVQVLICQEELILELD